jgi:hypothetical protein
VEWDSNMLAIKIAALGDFATHGGAVVSAILIHVIVLALGLAFAATRKRKQRLSSWAHAFAKVKMPGVVAVSAGIVSAPCMTAAIVLLAHPTSKPSTAIALGVIGVIVALLPLVLLLVLARIFYRDGEKLLSEEESENKTPLLPESSPDAVRQLVALVHWATAPRREYAPSKKSSSKFLLAHFEHCVAAHRSVAFAAFDFAITSILISILGGASACCTTATCCLVTGYMAASLLLVHAVVMLVFSVLLVRLDALVVPALSLLCCVIAVLGVVLSHAGADAAVDLLNVIEKIATAVYVIGLAMLAISMFANALPTLLFVFAKCNTTARTAHEALRKRRKEKSARRNHLNVVADFELALRSDHHRNPPSRAGRTGSRSRRDDDDHANGDLQHPRSRQRSATASASRGRGDSRGSSSRPGRVEEQRRSLPPPTTTAAAQPRPRSSRDRHGDADNNNRIINERELGDRYRARSGDRQHIGGRDRHLQPLRGERAGGERRSEQPRGSSRRSESNNRKTSQRIDKNDL